MMGRTQPVTASLGLVLDTAMDTATTSKCSRAKQPIVRAEGASTFLDFSTNISIIFERCIAATSCAYVFAVGLARNFMSERRSRDLSNEVHPEHESGVFSFETSRFDLQLAFPLVKPLVPRVVRFIILALISVRIRPRSAIRVVLHSAPTWKLT